MNNKIAFAQNGNGNGNGNNGNGTNWLPNNGNVGVGTMQPNYKLEVVGNSKFTENVKMDKDLTVNTISVFRIKPLPGDSLIHFGDSSIVLQAPANPFTVGYHRIYATTPQVAGGNNPSIERGLGFGMNTYAYSNFSYAIGRNVRSNAENSIAIGVVAEERTPVNPPIPQTILTNSIKNSIMLGANSPYSSIFIQPGTREKSGLVGINNVNPTRELDVEGDVRVRNLINPTGDAKVYADVDGTLKISTRPEPKPWLVEGNSGTNPNTNWLGTNDDQGLSIRTNATERIYINNGTGQVVITNKGYNNPRFIPAGYIFAVNGKAIMEECEIRLKATGGNWPDYVFADDYKLKTIEEQKEFIQKNKHLPGFKTAKEIESKESFGLGETQRLQQEKIEELYLYVIQLKEQNDTLKKQVEQLQNNK